MKTVIALMICLSAWFTAAPLLEARGFRGGGGGGRAKASAPSRGGGSAKRNPMTGSRIQRPTSRPQPRPAARPQARPQTRPQTRPQPRPQTRPEVQRPSVQRPSVQRPSVQRPSTQRLSSRHEGGRLPGAGNDNRPSIQRPNTNRPATLPGMVSYPNKPDKGKLPSRPGGADRPGIGDRDRPALGDRDRPGSADRFPGLGDRDRPGRIDHSKPSIVDRDRVNIDRDKINIGDRNNTYIENVNIGRRNNGLNRPSTLPATKRNWDGNRWGGNNSVWGNRVNIGNNVNINIDNNFRWNNNFAYRPNYWGARPWWGCGNYHGWHHGHWSYGWGASYYHRCWWYDDDDDFAKGFMWGIAAWSLGSLIYDMGYKSYQNPYPAPPVQNTYITYEQPVAVAAAANPPGDEAVSATADEKSADALEASRAAFKTGDYVTALKSADEALSYTPSDVTLHEYRALVLFALGKYADSAGVLNPVLASGPGWGWDTMVGFYNSESTYTDQLRKLEDYVKQSDKADGHFLLGYHYMVCNHLEAANGQFTKAAQLQPADTISRQLADLTADSTSSTSDAAPPPPAEPPAPVDPDKLVGAWAADGSGATISFTMTEDGNFTWAYQDSELKGTYGLNDKGLLVLTTDDTQMVSEVELKDDKSMHFAIIGAPAGDPGLDFTKG